ncbi:zf-HC2 domain-containing protein [Paenibacillus sp. MER 99-2]|uniref:zf-HC2 domain-containing protein n=1 Tax=Paenibacillus sp. MER 99-2 TaxID=2939572 RepID=UPI00203FF544|nr:zf-HC2 domain-containing protein [Paenibacillus sp. MER 99-2]MCM3171022.1 zf-HC2 domain-containing protein [Paenibacillus sp. MER 99-2]
MKCEEVVEWMHRYLDHDLGEVETEQLLQHVAKCPECAENFSLLRALSRELEDLPQVTPKFSLVDAIMPQLDAIDEARREQSSTMQEMSPVPAAFENLQRSSERKVKPSWFNSMVGRMSMGAAAAVLVLGVAIWGPKPEKIENAESMMGAGSAQESSNEDQNALRMEISNDDSSAPTEGDNRAMSGLSNEQNDTQPDTQESTSEVTPEENETEKLETQPQEDVAPKQPSADAGAKVDAPKETPSASTPSENQGNANQVQPDQQKSVDPGSADAPQAGSDDGAATEPENGEAESFTTQDVVPHVNNDEPATGMVAPNADQNPEQATESNNGLAGSDRGFAAVAPPATEWKSPNGSYLVLQIGNQLSIYSKSASDSDVLNLVEQRDLEGTLKSASWSKDSTVFNYETEKDGTAVKKSFNVAPAADSGNSGK